MTHGFNELITFLAKRIEYQAHSLLAVNKVADDRICLNLRKQHKAI